MRVRQSIATDRLFTQARGAAVFSVAAVVAAVSAHVLLTLAVSEGRYIPQPDLVDDYAIGVAWAAALGLVLWFGTPRRSDRGILAIAWGCKALVTLVLMLVYEASYDLDAYEYFAGPRRAWYTSQFSFGLGTDNVMAMSWLQQQLLPGSYHALKVSCSFIGLIGVYVFYRAAELHTGRRNRNLFFTLLAFPSILFWSSILGKDPLILFAVSVHVLGLVMWHQSHSLRATIVALFGLLMAAAIRQWLAPILLVPLGLIAFRFASRWQTKALLATAFLALGAIFVVAILRLFNATSLTEAIKTMNLLSRAWATGGSAQENIQAFSGIGSLAVFLPRGAFTALFRPLPGEIGNIFGLLAGLENAGLLVLTAIALRRVQRSSFRDPMVCWGLAVVAAWVVVYAFISYQNLGSAVRFKVQILPVLLLLLLDWSARESSMRMNRDAMTLMPKGSV
jgi:hypothetical protein